MPRILSSALCLAAVACWHAVSTNSPVDAPGLPGAGEAAVIFAPGVVSTGDVFASTFTPDGRTVVFTKFAPPRMTLMTSTLDGGGWSAPSVLPFSGTYRDLDPAFSPDGSRLYFSSWRPTSASPGDTLNAADTWYVDHNAHGWSNPVHLREPVNSAEQDYYPNITNRGVLYFDSFRSRPRRRLVYRAEARGDGFANPELLSATINADSGASNLFVDPDERYVVFGAVRPEGRGGVDLYVSWRRGETWTTPQNLGDQVNTPGTEFCPFVSRDGRYLYFTRAVTANGQTTRNIYVVRFDARLDRLAATASVPSARSDSQSFAIQRAIADSVERAQAGRILNEIQTRSTPLLRAANYLGMLQLLDSIRAHSDSSGPTISLTAQLIGTYDSFLGQNRSALAEFARGSRVEKPVDSATLAASVPEDAVDAVVARAATSQVVFINEAHHMPEHRAFTRALLARLHALGFTYLAAETLGETDSAMNRRAYPVHETGFYSNEPVFGDMLRTARQLGFTLVPYEAPSPDQDQRESGQARNLVARIFKNDPKARVIVHAGYSHIDESGLLGGAKPMAVRFRELTGIDPLTVDQTVMTDMGKRSLEDTRYTYVVEHFALRAPVVLRSGTGLWTSSPGVHDISVITPRVTYRDGRPEWLWSLNRHPLALPSDVCGHASDCAVTARFANESADAVPIDALRIYPGAESHTLALPSGTFDITVRDGAGALLRQWSVKIDR
jgi:hypothetical protein